VLFRADRRTDSLDTRNSGLRQFIEQPQKPTRLDGAMFAIYRIEFSPYISIYLSGFITAVAVFRKERTNQVMVKMTYENKTKPLVLMHRNVILQNF
jgi:hypothetical protein